MPCPFGFSASAVDGAEASGEDSSGEEEAELPGNVPMFCAGEVAEGQAGAEEDTTGGAVSKGRSKKSKGTSSQGKNEKVRPGKWLLSCSKSIGGL